METEVKLTKLASCAGCGAKVGAGTLVHLLEGFRTHSDPRLLVGYDRSDDASVYYLDENTALPVCRAISLCLSRRAHALKLRTRATAT